MRLHYYIAAILLVFVCYTSVQADEYGDISIQYVPMYSILLGAEPSQHGYVEYLFRVKNSDTSNSKKVSVQLVPAGYHMGGGDFGIKGASGLVEVPAGQTAQFVVLQPSIPFGSASIEARVSIDGRAQRDAMMLSIVDTHCDPNAFGMRMYSSTPNPMSSAQVLVSIETPTTFRDLFASGVESKTAGGGNSSESRTNAESAVPAEDAQVGTGGTIVLTNDPFGTNSSASGTTTISKEQGMQLWRAESDSAQWSDNWLAFSRFEAIVLTDAEMQSMPQPVWEAVRRFTETGGVLCVIGDSWTPPKEWKNIDGSEYKAVLGSAFFLKPSAEDSKDLIKKIRKQVIADSVKWGNAMQTDMWSRRGMTYHYGRSITPGFFSDPYTLSQFLPVSKSGARVPVKMISVLIIVFAVLIGPVNVYVLSMKNKRIWLLWTVPVISIIASTLVLGANFLQEGFARYASSATVTILDQRSEEAISFGLLGFYSTLTPPPAKFDVNTEVIVVANRASQRYTFTTMPGGEQVLTSGWINPRIPSYFGIRKAESRKERLEFQWESDSPTVANQLGVEIKTLTVCALDGKFYEANDIAAGQKTSLKEQNKPPMASLDPESVLSDRYSKISDWPNAPQALVSNMTRALTPGMYIISLGDARNPFIEPGLPDATQFQNASTIVGYFE